MVLISSIHLISFSVKMLKFGFLIFGVLFLSSSWLRLMNLFILRTLFIFLFNYNYNLGLISFVISDSVRMILIILSYWVTFLIFKIRFYLKISNNIVSLFSFFVNIMLFFLFFRFSTSNLLLFYIIFEARLVPIFLLIMGWGYQPERVKASYYLLFYTLAASLPLLLGIFFIGDSAGGLDYSVLTSFLKSRSFLFIIIVIAFLVKMPVYFIHLWLPKAHVEAPVAGSIILAGVLLKLGGYGLYRISLFIENDFNLYSSWLIGLAIVGGIISSLICVRQTDCKSLVAYSSVAHIALVLIGLFLNSFVAIIGAIVIMIAHGLCSSGLFALVGITYERLRTRRILLLRRSLTVAPILALWWFIFSISNMAAPPTPNLLGEIMIFISRLGWIGGVSFFVGIISFLGAAYNLFLFSSTQHGNENTVISGLGDRSLRENLVLFFHLSPLLLILPLLRNLICGYSLYLKFRFVVPEKSLRLITMTKNLYWRISFLLFNLSLTFLILGLYILINSSVVFLEWNLGGSSINFSCTFLFDFMSCLFARTVFFISSNVVWYSQSYLRADKDADRFILLVLGFVVSIFFLIVRPNIVRILLGWDGLGLISYCLVIYYPTKKSSRAGMLTVLRNRVGDVCILLAIGWFRCLGDFNFFIWVFDETFLNSSLILRLLIVFGAMTKRAQIPFSAWLPAAMAAPTPVSALVHSSTLVTAGVYLLIRFSYFLDENRKTVLMFLSALTMFMSGLVAIYEYDLKKIIALSTLSQLGVIIFSISLGLYTVAFFHLVIHALFKAILFLCAGVLIHGVGGSQDIRVYGSQIKNFPLVGVCLNLANLSLCGIPFISGFYSKDIVVELASQGIWNQFIIFIMFISLGFTVLYSVRLVYYSFVNSVSRDSNVFICDNDYIMVLPIISLRVASLLSGPSLSWLFFTEPSLVFLPFYLKLIAVVVVIFRIFLGVFLVEGGIYLFSSNLIKTFNGLMWFFPLLRGQGLSRLFLGSGSYVLKNFDQGWIEFCTIESISNQVYKFNKIRRALQANRLKNHFMIFLIWFIILFFFIFYFRSLNK